MDTGRKCDFTSDIVRRGLNLGQDPLSDFEVLLFEYFRDVCAIEFSLYFELPSWEGIILQVACTEPCIWHAALAISALSRSHYHRIESDSANVFTNEYAIKQYNLAIQKLNHCLDTSARSWELAVLASIIFVNIEVLQGHDNRVQVLLRSAFAILKTYGATVTSMSNSPNGDPLAVDANCPTSFGSIKTQAGLSYLSNALFQIDEQLSSFATLGR